MTSSMLTLVILLVIILAAFFGFKLKEHFDHRDTPDISTSFISSKIEELSDLTSAELVYNGIVRLTDGQIPWFTEKGFTMIYSANIRAGIDASQIKIESMDDAIYITLPPSTIQTIDVDPDSIEFYDTKYALFNWSGKRDVVEAIKAAKEDAEKKADLDALKVRATKNARKVIWEVLSSTIERKIYIR